MNKKLNIKRIPKKELKKVKGGRRDFIDHDKFLKDVEANNTQGSGFHIEIKKTS